MNIILLHLVEYLGHSNPFVCAVAYAEVCIRNCVFSYSTLNSLLDVCMSSSLTEIAFQACTAFIIDSLRAISAFLEDNFCNCH